jgi:purine nucleosidase
MRKIIIDTDPGCDDAIAILLAWASPELEVLGLSTIMGNAHLPQVTKNALKICEFAGRNDTKVHTGCPLPLFNLLDTAELVHGRDAMGELGLPEPSMAVQPVHAVDWIVDTVMSEPPQTITLCALGPLTNVAVAIAKQREVALRLKELAIMGGSFLAGGNSNWVTVAESNMANDPHAARLVFESGANITLAPLDLTHANLATPERIARVAAKGGRYNQLAARLLEFYARYDIEKMGLPGGPINDPCIIAWLIAPELFRHKRIHVAIETDSPRTLGMTVGDWYRVTGRKENTNVLYELDSDGFYDLLAVRLATL